MPSLFAFFRSVKETAKNALQGKLIPEDEYFERSFSRMLDVRKDLLLIEAGVKKWLGSARLLAVNAKALARAVNTPAKDVEAYSAEMESLLDELLVLKSVTKKVGLLDDLIRQRYLLRDYRVAKEGYERKLQQLEEQDRKALAKRPAAQTPNADDPPSGFDLQLKTVRAKIATCTSVYTRQKTELSAALDFFVQEAGEEGGVKLLAPELSAFRTTTFQFMLILQKLQLNTGSETEVAELETQWRAFARRMSTTVANAKSASKTDGKTHVNWSKELENELPVVAVGGGDAEDVIDVDASAGSQQREPSQEDDDADPRE